MLPLMERFDRLIAWVLAILLMLVILLATVHLAVTLFQDVFYQSPRFLIPIDQVLEIFGFFLIVLLGLELLESVRAYLRDDLIHVEVVLIVAIIALARKVIILEAKETAPLTIFGLAALVLALSASYRMVSQTLRNGAGSSTEKK
jgi:uncharacterized membrane protein (DUF373 family)